MAASPSMATLTGRQAIDYVAKHGGQLEKYPDRYDDGRSITVAEARRLDPSLVYATVWVESDVPTKFNRRPIQFPSNTSDATGLWYLIEVEQARTGVIQYRALRSPPRSNQSHQPIVRGWLGTSHDSSNYAIGRYRVSRRADGGWRFTEVEE